MGKIHIITVSTGTYNNFLTDFVNSVFEVLIPKLSKFDTDLIIISDENYIHENKQYNNKIKNYHIVNSVYPIVIFNKFLYVFDTYKVFNYDLSDKFIFVDVDSLFVKESNYDDIISDILNYDMIFSLSPWVCHPLSTIYYRNYNISINENPKKWSAGYRKNVSKNNFIQSSFLISDGISLCKLNNVIYNYASFDLNNNVRGRYIPEYIEQVYVNKFLDEQLNNNNIIIPDCKIKVDNYISNDYNNDYQNNFQSFKKVILEELSDKVFVTQKYNTKLKESKRNVVDFNIDE